MDNFLLKQNSKKSFNKIANYLRNSNLWLLKTPERAIEEAYQAALAIKAIEEQHFGGKKVSEDVTIYSKNILECFLDDVDKNLNIIKFS